MLFPRLHDYGFSFLDVLLRLALGLTIDPKKEVTTNVKLCIENSICQQRVPLLVRIKMPLSELRENSLAGANAATAMELIRMHNTVGTSIHQVFLGYTN